MNQNMTRRLDNAKIELWRRTAILADIDYADLAFLLVFHTKTADLLYDNCMDIVNKRGSKDSFILCKKILDLVNTIEPYDFLVTYRKLLLSSYEIENRVFTFFLQLMQLLCELVFKHTVCGFDSSTGEIFLEEDCPTMYELVMLLLGRIHSSFGFAFQVGGNGRKLNPVDFNKSEYFIQEKYSKDVCIKAVTNALHMPVLVEDSERHVLEVIENLLGYGFVIQAIQIFNDSYLPQRSTDCTVWKRETTDLRSEESDWFMSIFASTTGFLAERIEFLKYRNRLVREKGVVLRFAEPFDNVNQVFLKEVHQESTGEHYLYLLMQLDSGVQRPLVIDLLRPDTCYAQMCFQVDVSIVMLIFAWLGVIDTMRDTVAATTLTEFRKFLEVDDTVESSNLQMVKNSMLSFLDITDEFKSTLDEMEILEPLSWRYTGTTHFNKVVEKCKSYHYELRKVGAFVKRLPKGQEASQEARDAAERYCMELRPGYTLVSPFVRRQQVKTMDNF